MDLHETPAHAQQALAVYAESLAVGKRVAVFGDASLGIGARLADLCARAVHVWDPDFGRARFEAARAPRGVVVRALLDDDVEVRNGAFDVAIVPDLGLFDDADALLLLVRRLVGDEGAALVATGGPGADRTFDYYELFDRVAREFEEVRMIAQLPLYGVALAELGEDGESPAVTVDTQLADPDRSPQAFLALASQRGVRLDAYAIVELPPPPLVARVAEGAAEYGEERDKVQEEDDLGEDQQAEAAEREALSGALVEASLRIEALDAQLEELRSQLAAALQVMRAAEGLEDAVREGAARMLELEQALAVRDRQVAELSDEAEGLRAALQAGRAAANLAEQLALRAERAEGAVAVARTELLRASEAHASELGRYEENLRERAQVIRSLEAEVTRRERMVRDLVATLEETEESGTPHRPLERRPAEHLAVQSSLAERDALSAENTQLRAKLDDLALELARRVGEAQAAAWSIAELERKVAESPFERDPLPPSRAEPSEATAQPPEVAPHTHQTDNDAEDRLSAALDELNALRSALAQEHEARVHAESGDELARAREEIRRQAVLLDQLRAPTV